MATVYLKPSVYTDTYGGFPGIPSFGGEWDGSNVAGRNPDWLIGMRVSYNGKIYEALTNHDGDVNSPPNTNTTDWREVSGTLDDPYKATDLIQSNFLLDSLTDGDEVILTDGLYDYLPFSSTVYPQNGRPTLRALNDYEAIIGQSSFRPANILCVGLDVRSPAINGFSSYPDGGRVGFNYNRCILSANGFWWPPLNSVVSECLIKNTVSNGMFYASFGQATNPASTDKAIQMLNNTVILTSTTDKALLSNLINQGLMNPVFKKNIFYIKGHTGSTSLAWSNGFYQGTWENNVFFDASGQVVNNTGNLINIDPVFINPLGSSFRDFNLRPSSPLIGGVKEQNELLQKYPNGLWVDHNHSPTQASYNYTLDSGDGNNYTFSGDATGTDPVLSANIQDTLTFANNTGGHPIAIYNSQGVEVASESGGTTTFTPKYPDTYYYQCTVSGHENMRGDIVISMGTLGTESNPFSNYQHAIDARAYTGSCDLLFKEGDHPMNSGGGPNGLAFESSYPDGIRFIGSNAKSTRLVSLDNINPWPMLYSDTSRNDTNGTISGSDFYFIDIGIHINNTTSYVNRGILGVFRNLTMRGCIFSATSTASIYGTLIRAPLEWFDAKGCIFNLPLGKGPGGDTWWFGGGYGITRYRIESCCFLNLSGYRRPTYENNAFFGPNADANSYFKNNIAYSDISDMHSVVHYNGADFQIGWWATNWTGNLYYNSAVDFSYTPNTDSGQNIVTDPLFVDLTTENEDFRLKANSPAIGGVKKQETNVYYLQPGNPLNGDGSQKDASSMTTDGDPGPFNAFKNIVAAGVPYGSKVVILNGTYSWPSEFIRKNSSIWQDYTYEGYNYEAETFNEVIFDANRQSKHLGYIPYGGTPGAGQILDLDTSFTGIQFNNVVGGGESTSRNQIFTSSSSAGFGSCTFNNCKFLGWINTVAYQYPWTGGGRSQYGSTMHWKGCVISIAFDQAGGLLSGGDGFASDAYHGAWSWENCTFYIPVGLTTFNGRNAANGTYQSPSLLFGNNYNQSQRIFKNNIIYIPGGSTSTGTTLVNNLPSIKNNCFVGVVPRPEYFDFINDNNLLDVDPKFINPENNNFKLRPNSLLVGRGA